MSGGSSHSSPNSPQGSPEVSAKPSTAEKPVLSLPRLFQLKLAGFSRACSLLDRPAVDRVAADLSMLSSRSAPEDLEFLSPELVSAINMTPRKAAARPSAGHKQSQSQDHNAFDAATDVWAAALFGVLLLTGRSLFHKPDAQNTRTLIQAAADGSGSSNVREALAGVSAEASQLLCAMLSADRSKRPTAEQVLQSGWMKALEAAARLEGGASAASASQVSATTENAVPEAAQPSASPSASPSPTPLPDPDSDRVRALSNSLVSASAFAAMRAVLERRRNFFEGLAAAESSADSDPHRTLMAELSPQSLEESATAAAETVA